MIQTSAAKICLACGKPVKGRSDKKFCDDSCRNVYNNEQQSDSNNYIRNINNALRKNRRILKACLPAADKMVRTNTEKLLRQGFLFTYITHTLTNKKGSVYYFCYEYGYLPLENGWYLVVKSGK